MVKTISALYRDGVFIPLTAVNELCEDATVEISIQMPLLNAQSDDQDEEFSLEENLHLLHTTSGILSSNLSAAEIRYIIESPELAQENLYLSLGDGQ